MKRFIRSVLKLSGYELNRIHNLHNNVITSYLVEFREEGEIIRFCVQDKTEYIQFNHFNGSFFEYDELQIIGKVFSPGSLFVDIGANVGNHSIYSGKILHAGRIIAFEPDPISRRVLEINILLNDLKNITLIHDTAVSSDCGQGRLHRPEKNNWGRAQLTDSEVGVSVPLITGDEALKDEKVDFIKIDVESHEIDVLNGLSRTIERCRPSIFVEVDHKNTNTFLQIVNNIGYTVADKFSRYESNENYLILP